LKPNNEKIGIWLDDNAAVKRCECWVHGREERTWNEEKQWRTGKGEKIETVNNRYNFVSIQKRKEKKKTPSSCNSLANYEIVFPSPFLSPESFVP
jgi:hypothetical protein